MNDRILLSLTAVTGVALLVTLLYPAPIWEDELVGSLLAPDNDAGAPSTGQDGGGQFTEPTHLHAQLFFLINGERKPLTEQYMEREYWGHFHNDDNIFHKEAVGVTLGHALSSLAINVSDQCLSFTLDDEQYCADDGHAVRFNINGDTLPRDEALNHSIAQDDTIIVFYGDTNTTITEEYLERQLPDAYRPGYDNL